MKKQLNLNLFKGRRGGRRPGCGRKRIHSKGVAHRIREKVNFRTPLHINFKYKAFIKNKFCLRLLKRAILNSRKHGLKVLHFSLQHNHVHLIVEAESNSVLSTGMRSLLVTFAMGMKKGKIQIERYHLHVLKTINETKNAISYVLFNQQKHEKGISSKIDEYTSVLAMKNGLKIVSRFAVKNRMSLKIGIRDNFELNQSQGHLMKIALVGLV